MKNLPYAERRERIYAPLREEGVFTWDRMYGQEYALASLHEIDAAFRQEIAEATERLGAVFSKVVGIIQQGDVPLLGELGIPEAAYDAVRVAIAPEATLVGRFDFAPTAQGLKMLEFNSDTPTSIVEAFHVNGRACAFFGVQDPNAGCTDDLNSAFQKWTARYAELGYATEHIWFSALDWHDEDAGTTRYLLQQSGLPGRFVPLADLRVFEERLWALQGEELEPVDMLYRLHALEKLVEECDEDGYPTGVHVLDLVARRRLAILNPPSAFLAQTKALQALIWNLHEEGQFFTPEEHETIHTYVLPTFFEDRFQGRTPYVTKPIFGREGGGVTLRNREGEAVERDHEGEYWEQMMIYQERVELQPLDVETEQGTYSGHLLWGSFLIDGRASALVARVGGAITGNLSYFLPAGVR
jgi:glutathionylspermidine synthase